MVHSNSPKRPRAAMATQQVSLAEAYSQTIKLVRVLQPRFHPHMYVDIEDITMDLVTKWLHNGYLTRFDPDVATIGSYLRAAVRNHLISQERSALAEIRDRSKTVQESTITSRLYSDDGAGGTDSFFDSVPDNRPMCSLDSLILKDCLEKLSHAKSWGQKVVSPLTEETMQLSHFSVVLHKINGWSIPEIADMFSISKPRAHKIYSDAVKKMQAYT